ncbi:hypothetical protein HRS9139_04876 [Pyrenophora teres f. teres]|nr:hypothetical protein HRS9139_04876 [Pyrenophora teres f. teres]
MSTPILEDLNRFIDFINSGDIDIGKEIVSESAIFHIPFGSGPLKGLDGYLQILGMMRGAFPDIQWTLQETVCEGDTVVARFETKGTHNGFFMGVPPTGKPHWAEFVRFASEQGPDGEVKWEDALYQPVYSLALDDVVKTPRIDTTVPTQLGDARWEQFKTMHAEIYNANTSRLVCSTTFVILDQQSMEDHKAIVINKEQQWLTPEGEEAQLSSNPQDNVGIITKWVWKKHCFPFEESWRIQCALEGFSDPYLAEENFVEEEDGPVMEESEELETDGL